MRTKLNTKLSALSTPPATGLPGCGTDQRHHGGLSLIRPKARTTAVVTRGCRSVSSKGVTLAGGMAAAGSATAAPS